MPRKPARPCASARCPGRATHGRYCESCAADTAVVKLTHPCAAARCPHRAAVGSRYCDRCNPIRRHRVTRASAAVRGYGRDWRVLRADYLSTNPQCVVCGAVATQVDHIVPRGRGGTDDRHNLQSLCARCHSRKTAAEDGGFGNGQTRPRRSKQEERERATYAQFAARPRDEFRRGSPECIHVIGGAATGKSTLLQLLGRELGIPTFAIDDERAALMGNDDWLNSDDELAAWVALEDAMDGEFTCAVETSGHNANADVMLAGRRVYVVLCVARDVTRRQRLMTRMVGGYTLPTGVGHAERLTGRRDMAYVDRLMQIGRPKLNHDYLWDSDIDVGEQIGQLLAQITAWQGGRAKSLAALETA